MPPAGAIAHCQPSQCDTYNVVARMMCMLLEHKLSYRPHKHREPRGYDPNTLSDPLQDPQHCFNTFYRKQAESVLSGRARGHLL